MTNSLKQFHKNLESINTIDGIYTYFESQVKAVDLTEIIRAQFVLLVSAFDYYIHDLVRDGMLKVFDEVKKPNENYNKFSISLKTLNLLLSTNDNSLRRQILDNEIRNVTSKCSYQAPSNVERALALIDIKPIWGFVGKELKMTKDDIIKELGLIVNRRNKIAHEADIDPITNEKTPIDRQTLLDVKTFMIKIVTAIDRKV
jgi:hypothetical protein